MESKRITLLWYKILKSLRLDILPTLGALSKFTKSCFYINKWVLTSVDECQEELLAELINCKIPLLAITLLKFHSILFDS